MQSTESKMALNFNKHSKFKNHLLRLFTNSFTSGDWCCGLGGPLLPEDDQEHADAGGSR